MMHLIEAAARWAWETSLAASILIAIVLPVQLLCRKPALAPLRFILGFLVLARLLLPFAIPSPLSVHNVIPIQPEVLATPPTIHEIPARPSRVLIPPAPNHFPILPLLWATGAAVFLLNILRQHARVARWIRNSREIESGPALDAFRAARELMPVRMNVKLLQVAELSTPALSGFFRPKILLPARLLENPNPATLRLIFLHELAHIRRGDIFLNWAIIAAKAIHWFNPFAWLALRRLSADQELLCDAAVVRSLGLEDPRSYAETLLALASENAPGPGTVLPISANFKQMKERIAMITQFKPATKRRIALAIVIGLALSAITFTRAVDKRKPTPPKELSSATQPAQPRREESIAILQNELEKVTAQIDEKEDRLDDLRGKLNLTGPLANEDSLPVSETIAALERDQSRAAQDYSQFDGLLKSLKSTKRDKLRRILPTAYRDEALDRLLAHLEKVEQEYVSQTREKSDEHPDVKKLSAQIDAINRTIEERIDGVLSGLETLVAMKKATLDELRVSAAKAKEQDYEMRRNARPFFKLKREIQMSRKLQESLHLRLVEEQLESKMPKRF